MKCTGNLLEQGEMQYDLVLPKEKYSRATNTICKMDM